MYRFRVNHQRVLRTRPLRLNEKPYSMYMSMHYENEDCIGFLFFILKIHLDTFTKLTYGFRSRIAFVLSEPHSCC